ncbi:FtsX-like permease family protein [Fulvivirga sp. RKSG066]|uniref:ABC transporter permease n=1 Tax=Fulvivirga aurantia TaxID=2529383 RepID=UPI0012BD29D7|nr:ABC transporter permease [Fulvivirga aurantia]MTI21234.1 FtsX-like permease family protein [Fulvivirga aurantia]
MDQRLLANLYIAIEAVVANRVRSILTALGIIFGVAAVIAMLAIGNGAQEEILEQIKLVGVNNIVVSPVVEQTEEEIEEGFEDASEKQKFSPGLTMRDVEAIKKVVPGLATVSPEIVIDTYLIKGGVRRSAKLVGVEPSYFKISNFELAEGVMFNEDQLKKGAPVCIIGKSIKSKFFPTEDPIGKTIKCGRNWLKVIGVLKERVISNKSISNLGIRDYNMDVYTPLQTVLIRYENRDLVTQAMIRNANRGGGGMIIIMDGDGNGEGSKKNANYHQLDRLVVQVDETKMLNPTADVLSRLLQRRHFEVVDFEIEIPELLLKQQQRTNDIFNYVLGAIAGISLLVGGIGIMNIMLASVLERIKEIGLRLSLGAKKSDIINQFLFEAVMISVSGGIIGILLGVSLAYLVAEVAEIPTIVSFSSIILSFGVAATVGLIFGIAPARKAARQDPISSLRYE